jgi:signal transduction histidine kinase/ActR/RegA family two-component response regulator
VQPATDANPATAAPARPPTARLLVVEDAPAAREPPLPSRERGRRAASQVLAGAALRAAGDQTRLAGGLLLVLAAAEVALAWVWPGWQPAWTWAAIGVLGGLALLLGRWRWLREAPRPLLLAWVGGFTLWAVLPAWQAEPAHALAWLSAVVLASTALAAALAPQAGAAAAAALGPLLAGAAGGGPALLLGGGATGVALLLAARLRRRWQRHTLHALDQAERLRRLQTELDAAQRNDSDKSRFLAIASHDLRQPVHALGLFAATLHKRLHDSPDQALARNLMRSVDGLERSFNAMLDISRLDGGAVTPRPQTFPLRDVFRRLHMQYGGQAELAGLALRFSPGGKSVTSDPQLLERIVGNLVQNAIRYTTHGGVVVVARNTATHLNVEVWDTGCGITPENLPRIFDEFYQVGRGERDRSQGLGMGLAIVKRLVALLGHRLEVASAPGRGTMFRLGVPLGTLGGLDDETAAADTQPMAPEDDAARMVLVVDDEEPIREGLRLLLQEWGYQVMTAADAAQAERAVTALEGRVDLILSDLHLGHGPGGQEVVASVRRLCGREVPAILVTGDTAGQALREVAAGADPVLFKPVQPRHLLEALRNALEGRATGRTDG